MLSQISHSYWRRQCYTLILGFSDIDLIAGFTKDEGLATALYYSRTNIISKKYDEHNVTKDDFIAFIKEFDEKIHNLDADNITRVYLKNDYLNN